MTISSASVSGFSFYVLILIIACDDAGHL